MEFDQILTTLPAPAEKRIALRISPAAERAIRSGHPWLFANAIRQQSHDGRSGDLAVIFDRKRRFLAIGLYAPASPIRVRILAQGQPTKIDADWFLYKLETAVEQRLSLLQTNTTGYRLVHGENDAHPAGKRRHHVVRAGKIKRFQSSLEGRFLPISHLSSAISRPQLVAAPSAPP